MGSYPNPSAPRGASAMIPSTAPANVRTTAPTCEELGQLMELALVTGRDEKLSHAEGSPSTASPMMLRRLEGRPPIAIRCDPTDRPSTGRSAAPVSRRAGQETDGGSYSLPFRG